MIDLSLSVKKNSFMSVKLSVFIRAEISNTDINKKRFFKHVSALKLKKRLRKRTLDVIIVISFFPGFKNV